MRALVLAQHLLDRNMGAVRLRRLVRHLPRHGIEVAVITRDGPVPDDLAEDLRGVPLLGARAVDLASLYRRMAPRPPSSSDAAAPPTSRNIGLTSWANRWLMVPDKQAPWIGPAARAARAEIARARPDVLFASLEPRSHLVAAARIARATGIPCVMEYRDLWTGSPYHHLGLPTALHRAIHARLERSALAAATRVTAVSRGLADYLGRRYAGVLRQPVAVNYNFYDPAEYPPRATPTDPRFVIAYVGALYLSREPGAFLAGFRQFIDRRGLSPSDIAFRWAGSSYSVPELAARLDALRLAPFLEVRGQVPHREALQTLVDSQVALVIQAPDDRVHIPGKLFEAIGARVPVLAIAGDNELKGLIDRARAGCHAPHDPAAVAEALDTLWQHNRSGRPWPFAEAECHRFGVDAAVGGLAALLREACPP